MVARSIAGLSISFGLVSIPVKLYTATESSAAVRFKLMGQGGVRLRQQYVADAPLSEAEPPEESAPEPVRPAKVASPAASRVLSFPARAEVTTRREQTEPDRPVTVERSEMVKGYEFETGRFVLFTADELKALEAQARQTIDIVAFMPDRAVDPVYYDKAYFLTPDKRGAKPYSLLLRAMLATGKCALGKWA